MGDRATLEKIFAIMRRLLLVRMDGLNPIPRKGTTRHECYRALWEIQELLHTNQYFAELPPTTNADVAPVRHGRWIEADEQPYFRKNYHTMICSECRKKKNGNWNFCPNCGAKMDEDARHAETDR